MLKRAITFRNLDEVEVTKDFYFNLTTAELMILDGDYATEEGGFHGYLRRVMADNNKAEMIQTFDKLILQSVGKRTDDDIFIKTPEYTAGFRHSEAYSVLFYEICTNAGEAANFFNGVMPAKVVEQAKKLAAQGITPEMAVAMELPAPERKFPDDYGKDELTSMSAEEFHALMAKMPGKNIPRELLVIAMSKPLPPK